MLFETDGVIDYGSLMPLPIHHQDFAFTYRTLEASRRYVPERLAMLPTDLQTVPPIVAEDPEKLNQYIEIGRRIAEKIEKLTIGVDTVYTYAEGKTIDNLAALGLTEDDCAQPIIVEAQ